MIRGFSSLGNVQKAQSGGESGEIRRGGKRLHGVERARGAGTAGQWEPCSFKGGGRLGCRVRKIHWFFTVIVLPIGASGVDSTR